MQQNLELIKIVFNKYSNSHSNIEILNYIKFQIDIKTEKCKKFRQENKSFPSKMITTEEEELNNLILQYHIGLLLINNINTNWNLLETLYLLKK